MCANLCYLPESSKHQRVFYVTKHDKELNCCHGQQVISESNRMVTVKLNVVK